MTIKDQLHAELSQLIGIPSESQPVSLSFSANNGELSCEVVAVDALACSFHSLKYSTDRLSNATPEQLKKLCEKLSQQVNYLLEPIRPIEIDPEACIVQMRSNPPQKDEEGTSYYELVASRGGSVQLCRYNKQRGLPRRIVPATVTREVLGRLASDLSSW